MTERAQNQQNLPPPHGRILKPLDLAAIQRYQSGITNTHGAQQDHRDPKYHGLNTQYTELQATKQAQRDSGIQNRLVQTLEHAVDHEMNRRMHLEGEIRSLQQAIAIAEASRAQTEKLMSQNMKTTDLLAKHFNTMRTFIGGPQLSEDEKAIDFAAIFMKSESLKHENDNLKKILMEEREATRMHISMGNYQLQLKDNIIAQLESRCGIATGSEVKAR